MGQTLHSLDEKAFNSKDLEIEWVLSIGHVKAISYSKLKKPNFNFFFVPMNEVFPC